MTSGQYIGSHRTVCSFGWEGDIPDSPISLAEAAERLNIARIADGRWPLKVSTRALEIFRVVLFELGTKEVLFSQQNHMHVGKIDRDTGKK